MACLLKLSSLTVETNCPDKGVDPYYTQDSYKKAEPFLWMVSQEGDQSKEMLPQIHHFMHSSGATKDSGQQPSNKKGQEMSTQQPTGKTCFLWNSGRQPSNNKNGQGTTTQHAKKVLPVDSGMTPNKKKQPRAGNPPGK
jgi:hypothetical protein